MLRLILSNCSLISQVGLVKFIYPPQCHLKFDKYVAVDLIYCKIYSIAEMHFFQPSVSLLNRAREAHSMLNFEDYEN